MLKAYFFFIKHYCFTISVFLLTQLHLCAEMGAKAKLTKMASLAKNHLRADENLNEASRGAPCKVAKMTSEE